MKAGPKALDALLTLAGDNYLQWQVLIELLQDKGIIDEMELDARMIEKYAGDDAKSCAYWARHSLNTEDNGALDAFFDTDPE